MVIRGTPIVIYQMVRVRSRRLRILKALGFAQLHSSHSSSFGRQSEEKDEISVASRSAGVQQLEQGKLVRKYPDTSASPASGDHVVREPFSIDVSLFQDLQLHCPECIRDDGRMDLAMIQRVIRDAIERYDTATARIATV